MDRYKQEQVQPYWDGEPSGTQYGVSVYMVAKQILMEEADGKLVWLSLQLRLLAWCQGDNLSPMIVQSGLFTNPETGMFDVRHCSTLWQIKTEEHRLSNKLCWIQYKAIWVKLEDDNTRTNRLSEKYANLVANAVVTNKVEEAYYTKANSVVSDLAYVPQTVAQTHYGIDVQPTDADLKAYYDKHESYLPHKMVVLLWI